jgi:hypothetical protein
VKKPAIERAFLLQFHSIENTSMGTKYASIEVFLEYDRWKLRDIYRRIFGKAETRVQLIREAFFERFYPEFVGYCKGCGVKTRYKHDERRYVLYCSNVCMNSSATFAETIRNSYQQKYGMSPYEFLQQKHIREKRNLALGSEATKSKRLATTRERLGVDNSMQSPEVRAKLKRTTRERYGVDQHMQNPRQFKKWLQRTYRAQEYITTDGRTLLLQGYEPIIATTLEQNGWFVRSPKRGLTYRFQGKVCTYHPDLILKKKGRTFLAEVKSDYTLLGANSYKRNLAKFRAAEAISTFVLFVVTPRKDEFVAIRNPSELTKRDFISVVKGTANLEGVRRIKCRTLNEVTTAR